MVSRMNDPKPSKSGICGIAIANTTAMFLAEGWIVEGGGFPHVAQCSSYGCERPPTSAQSPSILQASMRAFVQAKEEK